MGTVWAAYDEVLHRSVAVKEVRLSSVPVNERAIVRERTLREARSTAMLSHPNVVTLYDVVEVNSEPYVVMELLPSRSLASYIGDRGTLTQPEAAEIGSAVASALATARASPTATSSPATSSSARTGRSSSPTSASPATPPSSP
jgi:serine/threonine protein kinase